ncbi:MAG: NosD domain-containing protein, partial [Candidatus Aenigmatarchaeota archaeon]
MQIKYIIGVLVIISMLLISLYNLRSTGYFIDLGNGECECNSCGDCINALNSPNCNIVYLTADISNWAGTCIINPANFNNKIFDCQGHIIGGDDSGYDYGIYLYNKQNNTIKNCIITDFETGIFLLSSSNNTLTNNTANSNSNSGIYLRFSSNNILTNNTMNNNIFNFGIFGDDISYYYQDIDTSNTVDGKPIYYWTNEKNAPNNCKNAEINESTNAGFVALISCDNITVKNLNLSKNDYGILLVNTTNSKILNNTVSSNGYTGIYLYSSSNNTLTNNIANSNSWYGIYLYSSSNNTLTNNTVNSNDVGISLESSSNNILTNNTANSNNYDGILLDSSSNNTLTNNTMNNNIFNFDILGDDVSYYYQDIDTSNTVDGKPIYYWTNKKYGPNNCKDAEINESTNAGFVALISCDNITVKNLNLIYNSKGILLVNTTNSKILNNNAILNFQGIYLYSSLNNTLTNNTANSNEFGIYLDSSSNNTLTNNIANSNNYGIRLYSSPNNTLTNNIASTNNEYGIYLYFSSNNNIYNNFFNNTNNFYFQGTAYLNTWNTTKAPGTNIVGGNYLGGNFWAKPGGIGFSETCDDTNYDGICDSSYTLTTNNIDYLPLSTKFNRPPQISLNEPENNTVFNNIQDINFNFTATDDLNNTFECSIYLDGNLNQTNSSVQNNTLTNFLIQGISYYNHNWYINCSDGELSNVSEKRYFTILLIDLSVQDILIEPSEVYTDTQITVKAKIYSTAQSSPKLKLFIDGNVYKYERVNLFSGINDLSYSIGALSAGEHTIKIEIDSDNEYSEINENNNIIEKTITIKQYLTCPICPEPSEWSECINGIQTRVVWICGPQTGFVCKSNIETRTCYINISEEENITQNI